MKNKIIQHHAFHASQLVLFLVFGAVDETYISYMMCLDI